MIREEILRDLESFTAGLDDTFKFHCTQCGKCCIERDDIMLSPMDIFKIAKELKISPHAFFYKYCTRVIGTHSRVPIVMLRPVGKNHRCPLLKNNKCAVHNVKPAVCGMFPLGRYIVLSPENYNKEGLNMLKKGQIVTVVYYAATEQEYLQLTGPVTKVDPYWHYLKIGDVEIEFSEIYETFTC